MLSNTTFWNMLTDYTKPEYMISPLINGYAINDYMMPEYMISHLINRYAN